MVIKRLIWDEWNITHIYEHNVIPEEVEEVCKGKHFFTKGRQKTYRVIGKTRDGRYLTIILAPRRKSEFYTVTARDEDSKEIRQYKKKRK